MDNKYISKSVYKIIADSKKEVKKERKGVMGLKVLEPITCRQMLTETPPD